MSNKLYIYDDANFYGEMKERGPSHRYRDKREDFIGPQPALKNEPSVMGLLDTIDKLEQQTRPSLGGDAKGKDMAASIALSHAAQLVSYVAGWAIDHQKGLALADLQFVPIVAKGIEERAEYLARRAAVDSHDHERNGADDGRRLTPVEARKFVLNMLLPMAEFLRLPREIIEAIEALDYGETLPILEKVKTSKRIGLTQYRSKLSALAYIEYQNGKGIKKGVSTDVIIEEFAVTRDAVKDWKVELYNALGTFDVDRTLEAAREAGRVHLESRNEPSLQHQTTREWCEYRYGGIALREAASLYRSRSKKTGKTKPG
jgi:hypothetical protein